ncbi:MAG: nuclease [Caulobacter sp.]|nr:nuclease [Caulobacter sp.]
MTLPPLGLLVFFALGWASPALADPCKAIPDRGPAPSWARPDYSVTGPVRYVADGDGLCVGASPDPATWVEIRLADFYAPELREPGGAAAKAMLVRVTRGRIVTCTAVRGRGRTVTYDRLIAVCRLDGVSLGDLMRRSGIAEGGAGR